VPPGRCRRRAKRPLRGPAEQGLFADPVRLPGPASAGDQLVAFLGRQLGPPMRPGPAAPKPGTRRRPVRGDSRESGWSISVGRQTSGAEPTRTRQNWVRHRGSTATSRVVVGDDIQEELDEVGLAQVMASLYPVDCQTCGLPIGTAQPVLHIDDLGGYAIADLHHSGCKTSEWNRANSAGLLIIRGTFSQEYLSWMYSSLLLPANAGYLPMILVNPGLEAIHLGRNPSGQWRNTRDFRCLWRAGRETIRRVTYDH
jgi:hypothetical protein